MPGGDGQFQLQRMQFLLHFCLFAPAQTPHAWKCCAHLELKGDQQSHSAAGTAFLDRVTGRHSFVMPE